MIEANKKLPEALDKLRQELEQFYRQELEAVKQNLKEEYYQTLQQELQQAAEEQEKLAMRLEELEKKNQLMAKENKLLIKQLNQRSTKKSYLDYAELGNAYYLAKKQGNNAILKFISEQDGETLKYFPLFDKASDFTLQAASIRAKGVLLNTADFIKALDDFKKEHVASKPHPPLTGVEQDQIKKLQLALQFIKEQDQLSNNLEQDLAANLAELLLQDKQYMIPGEVLARLNQIKRLDFMVYVGAENATTQFFDAASQATLKQELDKELDSMAAKKLEKHNKNKSEGPSLESIKQRIVADFTDFEGKTSKLATTVGRLTRALQRCLDQDGLPTELRERLIRMKNDYIADAESYLARFISQSNLTSHSLFSADQGHANPDNAKNRVLDSNEDNAALLAKQLGKN